MSIRIKFLIMFLSISIIPLLFISILTFNNYKKSIEAQRILELKDIAEIKAERIDSYFDYLSNNISIAQTFYNIKTNLPILNKFANDPKNPESISAKNTLDGQLQNMQALLDLSDIILINPQGKIVYLSDSKNFSNDLSEILPDSEQKNLKEGKNKIFYSEIFLNKARDNKLSMLIAVPALGFNDAFIGIIAYTFDMTEIYNIIQDVTGLGNTGEVLIVKIFNKKIIFLNPLRHDPKAALNRTEMLGDPIGQPAQEASQGKSGSGELVDYRGEKVIAAWNYIARIKWGMVAKIDVKEAFIEAENLKNLVFTILLIILGLSSVMAFSISQSISEPINRLAKGAEIIGHGNLDYKVAIGSKDEIGKLSRTFDKMTSDLKIVTASRDELNIEITERKKAEEALKQQSEELQQTNSMLEEQQQQLQQQSEELQQSNLELEERQQELQQQSEELQQINSLLEEQQQQLEIQAGELNIKNQNLARSKYEVEMANQYKSEFLANMSHELRTPLNSIILLSKIMARNEKSNFTEDDIKKLNVVYQSGNELLRLINDILDLSKIEAGKIDINLNSFSTSELLDELKNMFDSVAKEKRLDFFLEDNIKETIKTDKDKLSQIIRNFLSNAFKFTNLGFVKLSIDKSADNEYAYSITVQDSGQGIPSDKKEIIFEAFHQGDGSISRQYGGTGLGLSIAKELTKLINGKIILKSEAGTGSSFILLFNDLDNKKIELIKKREPVMEKDSLIQETKIFDDRNNINPEEIVVLVIDDDKIFAESLVEILHKNNYKALTAFSGKEGMALIKKYIPHAILLDLILPDTDGFEILRELKSTRELNNIPVMIISGKKKDKKYSMTGAFDYLEKPVDVDKLESLLQKMLLEAKKDSFNFQNTNNLLLVEDNANLRNAIKELLENDRIKIHEAESEEDALDKIKNNDFRLAIVDLGLKKGNGLEICKYIKENKLSIPVLIYTGKTISKQQEKNLKKYSESIILKTVNSDERLFQEVNYFLFKSKNNDSQKTQIKFNNFNNKLNIKNKTILIVDDDIKNVFVMTSALENFNVKILDVQNGKDAISILKKEKVDLVLMDIMMPVMDGYQTMREIRKIDEIKNIPIIALTAKALSGDREKCLEAGADDYIAKPIDYDSMINLISALIDKNNKGNGV